MTLTNHNLQSHTIRLNFHTIPYIPAILPISLHIGNQTPKLQNLQNSQNHSNDNNSHSHAIHHSMLQITHNFRLEMRWTLRLEFVEEFQEYV